MHMETMRLRNFRRLKDVRIDLASDISIFVGANNSGKTSASHALQLFNSASRDRFSIHDYSVDCRSEEHTSELQSLMRISYAVFCLKKNIQRRFTASQTLPIAHYRSIKLAS